MPERILDLINQQLALSEQVEEQEKRRKDLARQESIEQWKAMHTRNDKLMERANVRTIFETINLGLLCGKGEITYLPSHTIEIENLASGHDKGYTSYRSLTSCNLSWSMIADTPLQDNKLVYVTVEAKEGDEVSIEASFSSEEEVYRNGVVVEWDSAKWKPKRNTTLAKAVEESVAKKISKIILNCQNMGFSLPKK